MLETHKALNTKRASEGPKGIADFVFFSKNFKDETYYVEIGNQQERLERALGYVMGAYLGDGFVYKAKTQGPRVGLEVKDLEFAESFRNAMGLIAPGCKYTKILTLTKPNGKVTFKFNPVHTELGNFLIETFSNKQNIPDWIWKNENIAVGFLTGFIDAEGHFRSNGSCHITSTSIWIETIQEELTIKWGITSGLSWYKQKNPKWADYAILRIPAKQIAKIGLFLSIPRKRDRILKSSETTCYAPVNRMKI